MLLSVSRKTSLPQTRAMISSRVTMSPRRSSSRTRISRGIRSSFTTRLPRRRRLGERSSSKSSPNRMDGCSPIGWEVMRNPQKEIERFYISYGKLDASVIASYACGDTNHNAPTRAPLWTEPVLMAMMPHTQPIPVGKKHQEFGGKSYEKDLWALEQVAGSSAGWLVWGASRCRYG